MADWQPPSARIPIPDRIPELPPSKYVAWPQPLPSSFPFGVHKTTPVVPTMHLPPMSPMYSPGYAPPMMLGSPPSGTFSPLPLDQAHTPVWPRQAAAAPYTPFHGGGTNMYMFEPGTFPAEAWNTPVPIRVHPHISYNPIDPQIPCLAWDIIHRAEQARLLTGRLVYRTPDLKDVATAPKAKEIWIESDHSILCEWMQIWGPIEVKNDDGVTVLDILDAIYEYFHQPLTQSDYDRVAANSDALRGLIAASHERIQGSYENNYINWKRNGYLRSDVLGGHRRYQGLRPVAYQDGSWKLFLGLQPGPVPRFQ